MPISQYFKFALRQYCYNNPNSFLCSTFLPLLFLLFGLISLFVGISSLTKYKKLLKINAGLPHEQAIGKKQRKILENERDVYRICFFFSILFFLGALFI